jgi:hypothetical protein
VGVSPGRIETAGVEGGRVPRRPLQLRRLTASARALGLALPPALPTAADVARAAEGSAGSAAVRLTQAACGVRLAAGRAPGRRL